MSVLLAGIPLHERPRERLLAQGVEALTDRELLALVLRSGTRGVSALDLASELLAEFGSLGALASARPEELSTRPGVGPAKAASLIAAFRLGVRARASVDDPGGDPTPTDADRTATAAVKAAAGITGLRFLGHVVVAGDDWAQVS